jgi:hypothetical protein
LALGRLMKEGLSRHDALHAIGVALTEHMHRLLTAGEAPENPNAPYYEAVDKLTAKEWLALGEE